MRQSCVEGLHRRGVQAVGIQAQAPELRDAADLQRSRHLHEHQLSISIIPYIFPCLRISSGAFLYLLISTISSFFREEEYKKRSEPET